MSPFNLLGLACGIFVFIVLALCVSWAWGSKSYVLAVPLTILFIVACVAGIGALEHYGT